MKQYILNIPKKLFLYLLNHFFLAALLSSNFPFVSASLKEFSKFLMIAALAAIGINTDFREMKKSGITPMLHGFIISGLVAAL